MGGCRGACRAWSHWCGRRRRIRLRCPRVAAGPGQVHAHQVPPDGRPPRGLQGLAGLRDDAPSRRLAARTASGRAGPAAVGDQAAGPEGTRNTGGAHQVPPDGRLPQPRRCEGRRRTGLRCPWVAAGPGRASRRRAEPKARGADGERAGRRPRAHKAARRANCLYSPPTPGSGRPV